MTTQVLAGTGSRAPHAPTVRLLRAELHWIFHRPRTLVVLGLLAVLPVIVGVALTLADSPGPPGDGPGGEGGGSLLASAAGNALVLPVGTLAMTLALLLPLAAAMAGADALAGESAHGTLRGWLLAPVSRGKLLLVKAFGVATVAATAAFTMALTGMLTGLVINGGGTLFTLSGTTLSFPAAIGKVAVAAAWVSLQLWAVGAVALAISAWTEHPMLVVASVLAGIVLFSVLGLLDALSWLHPVLLNDSWQIALADVLRDPMPLDTLGEGALRAACYLAIGLSVAYARLTTKDG
ncbi:ABC-2 type transport system permease protein [Prauserella shujinwangii]|uniref:ABC-2 type transport system permease protein n=1 Tax=Prauserella shujinwangii TaxID=1453103 RepID=A0A2T0LY24_9PSEU|nr:ABC transporter permease subunit [Prauserella shujinwangii]PRX49018.1 ABC-2 type transport system permease protein [Prauserella shujinwangii]